MLNGNVAFSSFAVKDTEAAKEFYGKTLGLKVSDDPNMPGLLQLGLGSDQHVMIYPKPDHEPANFTVLNFPVADIDQVVDDLTAAGVTFKQYDDDPIKTDAKGIVRSDGKGPDIAWFTDPSGNVVSVIGDPSLK